MSFFQAFILSLLQGATEFLPVSSSGHIVIVQALFDLHGSANILFNVVVHVGTLTAIAVVFRHDLARLLHYCFAVAPRRTLRDGPGATWRDEPHGRMAVAIVVATIPTALIGLVGKDWFESLFEQPGRAGYALCFTGALLLTTLWRRGDVIRPDSESVRFAPFPLWVAFLIGMMQGFAIVPGISRSGSTIAVALLLGLNRRQAGEFSFFIAVPAILGALLLQVPDVVDGGLGSLRMSAALLAFLVSACSGWLFLRVLLWFVRRGQFWWFAIYCFALGIWAIFWF